MTLPQKWKGQKNMATENNPNYDIPLNNYNYLGFEDYPLLGSLALTYRGQQVIDELSSQGFDRPEDKKTKERA